MIATREMADRLVSKGLVTCKDVGDYTIFKYARKVFYKNLWTPELELFRGTVFKGSRLVVMPLRKVYNYGENSLGLNIPLDTPVILDYKVNGFMLNVTYVDNEFLFSTTGSLDSPFVELGKDMFSQFVSEEQIGLIRKMEGVPFTFEVVSTRDPHIISEAQGLHLLKIGDFTLGERNKIAEEYGFMYHSVAYSTLGEAIQRARVADFEGWMVYSLDETLLFKMKTKYYLTTKFLMRSKKASEYLFGPEAKEVFKDEEFFKLVQWIKESMTKEQWDEASEQIRRFWIEQFFINEGAF
jgi:hypothetical protein